MNGAVGMCVCVCVFFCLLRGGELSETSDGASHGSSGGGVENPGTSGHDFAAALAVPDSHSRALHRIFSAEGAGVAGGECKCIAYPRICS